MANTDHGSGRFSAAAIGGGTSRTLLVTGDPDTVISAALAVGASVTWRPGGRTNGKVSDAGPEETAHGLKIIPVAAFGLTLAERRKAALGHLALPGRPVTQNLHYLSH